MFFSEKNNFGASLNHPEEFLVWDCDWCHLENALYSQWLLVIGQSIKLGAHDCCLYLFITVIFYCGVVSSRKWSIIHFMTLSMKQGQHNGQCGVCVAWNSFLVKAGNLFRVQVQGISLDLYLTYTQLSSTRTFRDARGKSSRSTPVSGICKSVASTYLKNRYFCPIVPALSN